MSDVIRVLQLGSKDWSKCYELPKGMDWRYVQEFKAAPKAPYDIVFVDRELAEEEISPLMKATKAYTLFVTDSTVLSEEMSRFYACKKGKRIAEADIQNFLHKEARNYFAKPYGEKFEFKNLSIAQGFSGSITWNGNCGVTVQGDYGQEFGQIAFWRNTFLLLQGQAVEMWLEYEKDPSVEIALSVTQFKRGTISEVQQKWYFSEKELDDLVVLDNEMVAGQVFVSLLAKGTGTLKIIALHDRYSRRGHGMFLPGGERYVTSSREEFFYYFDPGDMKPPLNVYFSGYKTLQGFEGYNMMRSMGCPFLLIAEPRALGGCLYLGNEEYEKSLADIIRKYMSELGFSGEQVILSGISMGSFGALYYGKDILPHALIVGKPVTNVRVVAENERLRRPGGFPPALDMLYYLSGNFDGENIERVNAKFWDKFESTNWGNTKFVMAYMLEDDYDDRAYDMLISHLKADGVQVYGKGIHGRHNDATGAVVSWFKSQYEKILYEDFSRRIR